MFNTLYRIWLFNTLYRIWFKLTMLVLLCVAIVVTALYPYFYVDGDGFGIFISGIGGYHVSMVLP